jgi:hypothetical protein
MKMIRLAHCLAATSLAVVALLAIPAFAAAQNKDLDPFLGNYKGTAKMGTGEMGVTLELKVVDGKLAGHALAGDTDYKVTTSKVTNGVLAITFGSGADVATLSLKPSSDKLVGDWIKGTQKGSVELMKFDPAADVISGEWEAVADAQGQPFPFTLTMKLEGEKVTGSSSSQLGNTAFSTGAWKDGKLSILMDGGSGQIALVAQMIDGKLSGEYDFAGQASGKWVAIRKK